MHILRDPSFLFTNKTGVPQGEILGLIKPLSSNLLFEPSNLSIWPEPTDKEKLKWDMYPVTGQY